MGRQVVQNHPCYSTAAAGVRTTARERHGARVRVTVDNRNPSNRLPMYRTAAMRSRGPHRATELGWKTSTTTIGSRLRSGTRWYIYSRSTGWATQFSS